jgi:hypothetical protein
MTEPSILRSTPKPPASAAATIIPGAKLPPYVNFVNFAFLSDQPAR